MLADTLIRVPRRAGLETLQHRGTHGSRDLSTARLRLDAGVASTWCRPGEETVVVLHSGSGSWTVDGTEWRVSRRSVFEERATACYVPPGATLTARADTALEAVLFSVPARDGGAPALATPADVQVNTRGRNGYSREVHDVFVRDPHVRRLMVGETFNPPGHWSSFPPHKHDGLDGEPRLEEVYYYRVDPPQGFASQMLYAADGESVTHQVRDGDVVVLPYGYHPVCAPPGYRLYYLWALVGDERRLALFEDPAHRWIHEQA
jgi:5-deoxy-glucuronate isomerase